jgi:hypothetical protein
MSDTTRAATIRKIYYNPIDGFQNQARTLTAARRVDPDIKASDVRDFLRKQTATQMQTKRGDNSFIPQQKGVQMQFDLAFASRFPGSSPYKYAFIAIDIFSKKLAVIPQKTKEASETADSLDEAIKQLGVPVTSMSDEGTEFQGIFKARLRYYQIEGLTTRKHALFAERVIRTFKEKLLKRMEAMNIRRWDQLVPAVVKQYNSEEHAAVKMEPNEAEHVENHDVARENMKKRAKHNNRYDPINVGDEVRLLKKPEGNRASYRIGEDAFTRVTFAVTDKQSTTNGVAYTLENQQRAFLRHEIKLVTGSDAATKEEQDAMLERLNASFDNARDAPQPAPGFRRLRRLTREQVDR